MPLQVAVRHCPRHQKEDSKVAGGSNVAERAAKEAAKGMFIMPLVPVLDLSQFDPEYSSADLEKAKGWDFNEGPESRWKKNKKGATLFS